jgi:hypothetical protein
MSFVDRLHERSQNIWTSDKEISDNKLFNAAAVLIEDMTLALLQYRDDLNYPPTKDSLSRRFEMIDSLLKRV